MKSELVLEVHALSKSYWQGNQEVIVLSDIELTVAKGETIAIVGVSGSGKSTLLHLLAGLDKPDTGSVVIAGQSLADLNQTELGNLRNRHVGFVYQFHHLLPEFTARENVAMPLMIGGTPRRDAMAMAASLLDKVSMSHRADHHPAALSGGERQRVAIARALVGTPDLVLADEPTGNLDEENAVQVHELMLQLAGDMGISFVVVTHNNQFAGAMQRVLRLHGGSLAAAS